MATKSYKLRLDLRPNQPIADPGRFRTREQEIDDTRRWLDQTREAFNIGVDYLTGWLLRMHRGAGVWREHRDGIWREWHEITTLEELTHARQRREHAPASVALLENRELLDAFTRRGRSEAEAVELAECCRRIAQELCPPSDDSASAQMPRDDLDLLTLPTSTAKGIRDRGLTRTGEPKKRSGRRPRWILKQAIASVVSTSTGWDDFERQLKNTEQFKSADNDGKSLLATLRNKCTGEWRTDQQQIEEYASTWKADRDKAEKRNQDSAASGSIAAYRKLLEMGCLPLPGLLRPSAYLQMENTLAEWNYAMWNVAGQRVRSHLGWVRRRARERLLWQLRTSLFERGGWIRARRDGKTIREDEIVPDDIRFDQPHATEASDFERRPAYAGRRWVQTLRQYETDEMPRHLEDVAFGAAGQLRLRKRTAKGWAKVREKWINLIGKASDACDPPPSADDLLEAFDEMRTRRTRDFGDRHLFEWLAAPERRWLWEGSDKGDENDCGRQDRDCLAAFIAHNERLADKPESITFTRSDPVRHPVWPFFGENSAVEYWMTKSTSSAGKTRLVLVLKQLLQRQEGGSYSAVDNVKIALRGYDDFERSFVLPDTAATVSAKQALVFRDDLLGGQTRHGTLSGMKLTWERDELEACHRKPTPTNKPPRIYANFSCDAGDAALPDWLSSHVGSNVTLTKPRDGMSRAFFLKKAIARNDGNGDETSRLPPGQRRWPPQAIQHGLTVRGTDLGYRTSSAGAYWRLSLDKPDGAVAWQVGECEQKPVYAVLERTSTVSLPGDGQALPAEEQVLRERLYLLRTRLNLNNAILRIARLLALESVTQRKPGDEKVRRRSDGTTKPIGTKWTTQTRTLQEDEIRDNCRKAAQQLIRWASTDAMTESLKAVGHQGSLWNWLAQRDALLRELAGKVPTTEVPTEKQAKEMRLDRQAARARHYAEDRAFAEIVFRCRHPLARALCDGYDAGQRRRGTAGLWFEFDRALMREVSYGDRGHHGGQRNLFANGLLRLLRRPPVTKHRDRKDETNNLPDGRTHRGGLSMARLNFLDDVKNFVRRWSCRPRWPGDLRRIPRDARVNRGDTEHLDNLREHRAKLIAHADVAQTLGFEQDLRRGLWRYRDKSGQLLWHRPERGHFYRQDGDRLVQCTAPEGLTEEATQHPHAAYDRAHVLVYEDLTRYRMSSDRPRSENAGLARWSHRRILAFAQHVGGLFGVPVATVDARFSSRYCSRCGAPGCRADRFDPAWLNQRWMQRVLRSDDIRDAAMKSVANQVRTTIEQHPDAFRREEARPWVLRDGGSHFVCANPDCPVHSAPIDADQNAAANIGLRFLRGIDGIRVTVGGNGAVTRSVGFVKPGTVLVPAANPPAREPYWQSADTHSSRTGGVKGHRRANDRPAPPGNEIDADDESPGVRVLFRDPSGGLYPKDRWFEGNVFWGAVACSCAAGIKAVNASRFGSADED